ncbi:hypothetical protein Sango_2703900 [Sesamum angolense]|uniref:NB-ARC domain-containing protein n=1 Tax=Sesamum angolense TaxID=2727404 RepID=A0AAE1W2Z8_9LAMI|nr:hypothetical protein Sango_2703900 [Sesamum angolense]
MRQQLPKVTEAVESIVEEVMAIKNSLGAVQDPQVLTDSSPPATSSTALLPTKKYNKKDAMNIGSVHNYSIQEMLFALVDSIKALNEKFDGGKHSYEQMQNNNGSRIIITTRLQDVAAYADSSSPLHEMHFMDVDQSWILLRQKVFNEQHCPPELENIGKMIARSCKGLRSQ